MFTKFNLYLIAVALISLTACKKNNNNGDGPAPSSAHVPSAWTKVPSLPATEKFTLLETSGNSIYAISSSNKLYISSDLGATWSSSDIKPVLPNLNISALAVFENKIYAATTSSGIYVSADNGKTWNIQGSGALNTSFTVWKGDLYVSSAEGISAATGVLVLNKRSGTWIPFNSAGIPSNYDLDVTKTIVVNQTMASIRGTNGKFYGYGDASSQWNQISYFPEYHNVKMQDIVYDGGVMLVSSGYQVLYSNNFANSWSYDTVGLKKVLQPFLNKTRVLYAADHEFYVLTNMPAGGTWIQERDQSVPAGTTWTKGEEFLPLNQGFTYDMKFLDDVLFIATDDGIYYKKAS